MNGPKVTPLPPDLAKMAAQAKDLADPVTAIRDKSRSLIDGAEALFIVAINSEGVPGTAAFAKNRGTNVALIGEVTLLQAALAQSTLAHQQQQSGGDE